MIPLNKLAFETHQLACAHGFSKHGPMTPHEIMSKLMLIVTEAAEAAEGIRVQEPVQYTVAVEFAGEKISPGKPSGLANELADIIIRTVELAHSLDIDIDAAVVMKHDYNKMRPVAHGGKIL